MSVEAERARLTRGAAGEDAPGGVGLVSVRVSSPGPVSQVLVRAREVLLVAQGLDVAQHSATAAWTVLPEWFLAACAPQRTEDEQVAWLAWWRSLPREDRARAEEEAGWTAENWLSWIDPSDRPWLWWDSFETDDHHARVRIEVFGWPTPTGALEWLLRAAGAEHVVVVDAPD